MKRTVQESRSVIWNFEDTSFKVGTGERGLYLTSYSSALGNAMSLTWKQAKQLQSILEEALKESK